MHPEPRLVCKWLLSLRVDVSSRHPVWDYQFRIDPAANVRFFLAMKQRKPSGSRPKFRTFGLW
jgi:hypothetical protein